MHQIQWRIGAFITVVGLFSIVCILTFSQRYTMQRREPAIIPVESGLSRSARQHRELVESRPSRSAAQRREQVTSQPSRAPNSDPSFADEAVTTNTDAYFRGVLNQFPDDSSILDPLHYGATSSAAASQSVSPYSDLPFGHSAVEEFLIDLDTLGLASMYNGSSSGEVTYQLNEINNTPAPIRVVQISISQFFFPRIYLTQVPDYEYFYLKRVYMQLQFIPMLSQTQTLSSNTLFTFELAVDIIDVNFVRLTPLRPTITLQQPTNLPGALTIKYFNRNPNGIGSIAIPATRVLASRYATGVLPTYTAYQFTMASPDGITVLGPTGAGATAVVQLARSTTGPATVLEQLLDGRIVVAYDFTVLLAPPDPPAGSFKIPTNTAAFPILPGESPIYVYIPKNAFSVPMHFLSLNPARTNELIPTFQ